MSLPDPLIDACDRLHEASDRMNALFPKVERMLNDLAPGVSVTVPLDETTGLSFRRHQKQWGLFIVYPNENVTHIAQASRRDRVASAFKLAELISALEAETVQQANNASAACLEIESMLRAAGVDPDAKEETDGPVA